MKKFVIGLIVGAIAMVSTQALGAEISFTGKKVSGETVVKVNGEVAGNAIIVDNKSFIPVRDISNKIGAEVSLEKGGLISLTFPNSTGNLPSSDTNAEAIKKQQALIDETKRKQKETSEKVSQYEELLKSTTSPIHKPRYQNNYDAFEKSLDQLNQLLKDQEAVLKSLEESQID